MSAQRRAASPFDGVELAEAQASIARNGKTFSFAARLLPIGARQAASLLYAVCREIDDLADEAVDAASAARLERLRDARWSASDADPLARRLAALTGVGGVDANAMRDLIRGVAADLAPVRVADVDGLLRYAYHVAGSVGLMMSGLLGATTHSAKLHAIDLGIAMQLTNIARDVVEDARMGRRYLPGTWCPYAPSAIATPDDAVRLSVRESVLALLDLADRFYESGAAGYGHLPARARIGVAAAARGYRAIGTRLRRWDGDVWRGRARTNMLEKTAHAAAALAQAARTEIRHHDPSLHAALRREPAAASYRALTNVG